MIMIVIITLIIIPWELLLNQSTEDLLKSHWCSFDNKPVPAKHGLKDV